jgi:hypothetical protein
MSKKVQERTEILLKNMPQTRNSDKALLLEYWEREGLVLTASQQLTFRNLCTPAESITRARRMLRDKYPAETAVETERRKKEAAMRESKGVQ